MYKLGLIAKDIKNSVTPAIYKTLMEKVGEKSSYEILNISEDKLRETVEYARNNFNGFNVTMPYKQEILKYIDVIDESAEKCGSTNTVLVENGKLIAYNTDGVGLIIALQKDGFDFKDKKVVMVGAGGVACSIGYNLLINQVKSVDVINLYMDQAEDLCNRFGNKFKAFPLDYETLNKVCVDADLFINASVMGQIGYDDYKEFSFLDNLKKDAVVFDVNYSNKNAKLLPNAEDKGFKTYIGSYMTVCQAVKVMRIWCKKTPSEKAIDELINSLVKGDK